MSKRNLGLYLIPSPLHEEGFSFLPDGVWESLEDIKLFIVENAREARRGLRRMGYKGDFNSLQMLEWNENSTPGDHSNVFSALANEKKAVLMSDAGLPCIADPGNVVVMKAKLLTIQTRSH